MLELLVRFIPQMWDHRECILPVFTHVEGSVGEILAKLDNLLSEFCDKLNPEIAKLRTKGLVEALKDFQQGDPNSVSSSPPPKSRRT
jgi:hypothetical protein